MKRFLIVCVLLLVFLGGCKAKEPVVEKSTAEEVAVVENPPDATIVNPVTETTIVEPVKTPSVTTQSTNTIAETEYLKTYANRASEQFLMYSEFTLVIIDELGNTADKDILKAMDLVTAKCGDFGNSINNVSVSTEEGRELLSSIRECNSSWKAVFTDLRNCYLWHRSNDADSLESSLARANKSAEAFKRARQAL